MQTITRTVLERLLEDDSFTAVFLRDREACLRDFPELSMAERRALYQLDLDAFRNADADERRFRPLQEYCRII